MDVSEDEIVERLAAADDGDGQLNRSEFIDLCIQNLWNTPMEQLQMAADNFAEFTQMAANRTQAVTSTITSPVTLHGRQPDGDRYINHYTGRHAGQVAARREQHRSLVPPLGANQLSRLPSRHLHGRV